jgi:hypothetical protein
MAFPRPDASPPRGAQLMGLALRGYLVLVLGATAERRNLLFRSDLGLPWIRTFRSTPFIQVKQQNGLGRAINGHLADRHQFPSRTCSAGSTASTPISPDIGEPIEAVWPPFMWKTILDNRSSSPKSWAPRRHPWCSRRWSAKPEGAQPADNPVAVARCGNQHVGGGCCASSRPIP